MSNVPTPALVSDPDPLEGAPPGGTAVTADSAAARDRRRFRPSPLSFLSVFVLIAAWVVVTRLELVSDLKMPTPEGVWDTATQIKFRVFGDLGLTLYRVFVGFVVGGALGIAVGLLMSLSRVVRLLLDPLIEIFRPIPPLAFIPFIILWMGIGDGGKLVLIGLGSFLTLVVTTVEATRTVPPVFIQAARTLGASSGHVYRTVILPAIVPNIMGGVRVALGMSFAVGIAAEFMGAQRGIGYIMIVSQRTLQTDAVLYAMIILAIVAFLSDRLVRRIGRSVTGWAERLDEA